MAEGLILKLGSRTSTQPQPAQLVATAANAMQGRLGSARASEWMPTVVRGGHAMSMKGCDYLDDGSAPSLSLGDCSLLRNFAVKQQRPAASCMQGDAEDVQVLGGPCQR